MSIKPKQSSTISKSQNSSSSSFAERSRRPVAIVLKKGINSSRGHLMVGYAFPLKNQINQRSPPPIKSSQISYIGSGAGRMHDLIAMAFAQIWRPMRIKRLRAKWM
jgi:hypothetical protein